MHHSRSALVVLALLTAALAGCGQTGPAATVSPAPGASGSPSGEPAGPVITDAHATITLPPTLTFNGPTTSDGQSTYRVGSLDGKVDGQLAILTLAASTASPGMAEHLQSESITALALEVDGTTAGSTNVKSIEPVHTVSVAGETCAQLGIESTYQGQTGDGIYLNCRHAGYLYSLVLISDPGTQHDLDTTIADIVQNWRWTP